MSNIAEDNTRADYDQVLKDIADYVCDYEITSEQAFSTAKLCLIDSLGCALLALQFPECTKHLGPVVTGTSVPNGARVVGTSYVLDPIEAAFNIGTLIRWLDFNDTWLAAEWGHPSDNLGAILAVADYLSRVQISEGKPPLTMHEVLIAMIKAHEIQGVLALENSFNRVGLDHVVLVKVASTAVITYMLGGSKQNILDALSQAWVDGQSLRTYRHSPNTGSRKSWAAGDACARAVRLSMITLKGEMGYPGVLTAKGWGFYDVLFKGKPFRFQRPYESYVMENILFKISFPAEFHAQTAVECAVILHDKVVGRLDEIERIELTTHESAIRIISKTGALQNPADRDHCLQYMVAIGLIFGDLSAEHYEDGVASDARIDLLREKMQVNEKKQYSVDYHDPSKRSIANAIQVFFKDDTSTEKVEVEYPIGHHKRRKEGIPVLERKFSRHLCGQFTDMQSDKIIAVCDDQAILEKMPVNEFVGLFVPG